MKSIFLYIFLSALGYIQLISDGSRVENVSNNVIFSVPNSLIKLRQEEIDKEFPIMNERPNAVYKNGLIKFALNIKSTVAQDKDLPAIKNYFEKLYKGISAIDFLNSAGARVSRVPMVL